MAAPHLNLLLCPGAVLLDELGDMGADEGAMHGSDLLDHARPGGRGLGVSHLVALQLLEGLGDGEGGASGEGMGLCFSPVCSAR